VALEIQLPFFMGIYEFAMDRRRQGTILPFRRAGRETAIHSASQNQFLVPFRR
jgi:hypothetical protein